MKGLSFPHNTIQKHLVIHFHVDANLIAFLPIHSVACWVHSIVTPEGATESSATAALLSPLSANAVRHLLNERANLVATSPCIDGTSCGADKLECEAHAVIGFSVSLEW